MLNINGTHVARLAGGAVQHVRNTQAFEPFHIRGAPGVAQIQVWSHVDGQPVHAPDLRLALCVAETRGPVEVASIFEITAVGLEAPFKIHASE